MTLRLREKSLLKPVPAGLSSPAGANIFIFIDFWNTEKACAKFLFMAIYMHIHRGGSREQLVSHFKSLSEPVRLRSQEDSDEGQNVDL
jgi:hypothetical protein